MCAWEMLNLRSEVGHRPGESPAHPPRLAGAVGMSIWLGQVLG